MSIATNVYRIWSSAWAKRFSITAANDLSLNCVGDVNSKIQFEGKTTPIHALVTDNHQEDFLLSWKDLQRMSIICDKSHVLPAASRHTAPVQTQPDTLDDLMKEFADVFSEESITPMSGQPMCNERLCTKIMKAKLTTKRTS